MQQLDAPLLRLQRPRHGENGPGAREKTALRNLQLLERRAELLGRGRARASSVSATVRSDDPT